MDTHRIIKEKNCLTLAVALVLSGMVVTIAAFLGRGMLQIKSALTAEEPNELTVDMLVMERDPEVSIVNVTALPHRDASDDYAFLYELSNGEKYLARVAMRSARWQLKGEPELLHGVEPAVER